MYKLMTNQTDTTTGMEQRVISIRHSYYLLPYSWNGWVHRIPSLHECVLASNSIPACLRQDYGTGNQVHVQYFSLVANDY